MQTIPVKTGRRKEMVDVTERVRQAVAESGIKDGLVAVYVPHTSAAITINENADPSVPHDLMTLLEKMVPAHGDYHHREGNADAHIQSTLVGSSVTLILENGELSLGTWQGIFFCEFDGPRSRKLLIKVMGA